MSVIENFAVIPAKEQVAFATKLLEKINAESVFTSDTKFDFVGVDPDDLTGGLWIDVSHATPIGVSRKAVWQALDEEDAEKNPDDVDYEDSLANDAKKAFKTLTTVIDGYKVSVEIHDIDEGDLVEVEIDTISHEDAGIGEYEYFGFRGHDSRPYVEASGTLVEDCDFSLSFFVEANDAIEPEVDEEI